MKIQLISIGRGEHDLTFHSGVTEIDVSISLSKKQWLELDKIVKEKLRLIKENER